MLMLGVVIVVARVVVVSCRVKDIPGSVIVIHRACAAVYTVCCSHGPWFAINIDIMHFKITERPKAQWSEQGL